MTGRRLLRLLPGLIGLALLVWLVDLVSAGDIVAVLRRLSPAAVGILMMVNAAVLLTITARWWLLLRGQGHHVPLGPLFAYRLAVFGLSYFTPGPHIGGEPLQVLLVERRHGVPRPVALAAVALDKAIEFSVNFTFLLLGIAAVLRWRIVPADAGRQALGLAAALLVLPLLYLTATAFGRDPLARLVHALAGSRPLARARPRLLAAAGTLAESERAAGNFYRRSPGLFVAAVAVTLVSWALLIGEYWLMIHFLKIDLTLPQLVTTLTAARIAILLLLPAGLGALEGSQALSFAALGLDPAVGISAALLIRARDTVVAAFGLWWVTVNRREDSRRLGGRRSTPPPSHTHPPDAP